MWPRPRRLRRSAKAFQVSIGTLFYLAYAYIVYAFAVHFSELVPATFSGQPPSSLAPAGLIVNPVHVIDLSVVLPGMITIGVLSLRGNGTGSFLAVPALVFSVLMGSSIIAAMVLIAADGDTGGLVPMGMVSVVVLASLAAAIAYARRTGEPDRAPATQ